MQTYAKEFANKEEAMVYKRDNGVPVHRYDDTTNPVKWYFLSIDEWLNGEQLPLVTFDSNYLYIEECNPLHCKLYRYIRTPNTSEVEAPLEHNYVIGLTTKLHPKRTLIKGELKEISWYADDSETDLILKVDVDYNRDSLGFALSRTTTRTWYREDGTAHPDQKITSKTYDDLDQINEGVRRRGNLHKALQKPILGMMLLTIQGKTATDIVQDGRDFLKYYQNDFNAFVDESHKGVLDLISADTIHTWLDNDIGGGLTIRMYILDALTI